AENCIYAMQGLKSSFVCISIPGFSCSDIYTFYSLTLWCFHRPLKKKSQSFDGLLGLGGHSIAVAFVKNPFTHVNKYILKRHLVGLKDFQNSFHYFWSDSIAVGYCYFHNVNLKIFRP